MHTIEQILKTEDWTGNDGKAMKTYELKLSGFMQSAFAYRPASARAPEVGDEGLIDTSGKRPKFYVPKQASNGSEATGGGYNDPATIRRITRSHSQEMALRLIQATGDAKDMDLSQTEVVKAYLNGPLRRLVDWFDRDVQSVEQQEPTF